MGSYEQTLQNNKKIMLVLMPLAEIYSLIHSLKIYFYTSERSFINDGGFKLIPTKSVQV